MNGLLSELKRRNVFRVGVAYTVMGWLIIQVVDTLAPRMAMPEWVPGFAIIVVLIGFPIGLFFAWAYEITPAGLRKTKEVDVAASVTADTGRKIDRMIMGALVVLVGFLLADRFIGSTGMGLADASGTSSLTSQASIAVLPFVNLSSDPEQEWFSDGISEELLNLLAQIPNLRVAARTSSFQFKGDNRDITEIGKQLNVGHIVEGSVRKAGLRVRITAQLIDAGNGFHLWSETFDRELEDIFAVQDEISAAIVVALKERLGLEVEMAPRAVAPVNTEAHQAYLRGRHLVVQRTRATIEGAVDEFENAIAIEPDYALAHAELAMSFRLLSRAQYGDLTLSESMARAEPHATRALALAPDLAEAHAAVAYAAWGNEAFDPVLAGFRRAIAINPNYAIVHTWMGNILGDDLGRYGEAFTTEAIALGLDPLSIPAIGNRVRSLFDRDRVDEAERELEKLGSIAPAFYANIRAEAASRRGQWANGVLGDLDALSVNPGFVRAKFFLGFSFANLGLGPEAEAIFSPALPFVFSLLGRTEDAVSAAEALLAADPESLANELGLGLALAGTGDYDRARPILEEMWQRSGRRVTDGGLFRTIPAAALIAARRAADGKASVGELLDAVEDNIRRYRSAGITGARSGFFEGLGTYLGGDHERGLALIAQAVDEGYFFLPNAAYLEGLYGDPGFAPIRAAQDARQAEERAEFLAVVCADNPYAAVWQPSEVACAG